MAQGWRMHEMTHVPRPGPVHGHTRSSRLTLAANHTFGGCAGYPPLRPCLVPQAATEEAGRREPETDSALHSGDHSLRCWRARRFPCRAGYRFEVAHDRGLRGARRALGARATRGAATYVFVVRQPLGGMATVRAHADSGQLEHLLHDELQAAPSGPEVRKGPIPRTSPLGVPRGSRKSSGATIRKGFHAPSS